MTPEKLALIKSFVEIKTLAAAVKDALLEGITPQGMERFISLLDRTKPDAEYGQQVKMRAEAAKILEDGFAQLIKVTNAPQGVHSSLCRLLSASRSSCSGFGYARRDASCAKPEIIGTCYLAGSGS